MNYFSAAPLRASADRILMESRLAANDAAAQSILTKEASAMRISPVPTDPAEKPVVLFDIFLSHSSLDLRLVLGLYTELTKWNYKVYLDRFCDPHLDRTKVTGATARTMRYRIAQSKSLFVATTSNTPKSAWVPWELGLSDGWNGKAAVLPLMEAGQTTFIGNEYFEIYPEIKDGQTTIQGRRSKPDDLWVIVDRKFDSHWGTWINKSRKF
jgi:hypothetical protein